MSNERPSIAIVVPTYSRERVLLDSLERLFGLEERADEILVVDQTPAHEKETEAALGRWNDEGRLRWLRLAKASIPSAMNTGLREASKDVVLFLDDDIIPMAGLVAAHRRAHATGEVLAVTGMVLQPGDEPLNKEPNPGKRNGLRRDLSFSFRSEEPRDVWNVMAGNLSVKRQAALDCGGFDESFVGVAYRFETEFCRRLRRHGGRVTYEPSAAIRHLKAPSGGTRAWGNHQTSARPEHSVGDYYFILLEGRGREVVTCALRRIRQETLSRFHLAHPWYIPIKAVGEVRGFLMALRLAARRRRAG